MDASACPELAPFAGSGVGSVSSDESEFANNRLIDSSGLVKGDAESGPDVARRGILTFWKVGADEALGDRWPGL